MKAESFRIKKPTPPIKGPHFAVTLFIILLPLLVRGEYLAFPIGLAAYFLFTNLKYWRAPRQVTIDENGLQVEEWRSRDVTLIPAETIERLLWGENSVAVHYCSETGEPKSLDLFEERVPEGDWQRLKDALRMFETHPSDGATSR